MLTFSHLFRNLFSYVFISFPGTFSTFSALPTPTSRRRLEKVGRVEKVEEVPGKGRKEVGSGRRRWEKDRDRTRRDEDGTRGGWQRLLRRPTPLAPGAPPSPGATALFFDYLFQLAHTFSSFIERLQPSKTTILKTPGTLRVEKSSSP